MREILKSSGSEKGEMSETFSIPLSNISFLMSELNKELIQSSLFIYFKRLFAKNCYLFYVNVASFSQENLPLYSYF